MSSTTFSGNSESGGPGFCPAPPPPPPPPPVPGQVPALRINTVEAPVPRRSLPNNNPYEPPAAIQNAMMTKDKKPFTYTPGMGGKLDLSQIRSPRMARRVAKNANDEGIEGPPKSSLATETRPLSTGSNIYIQPQVAVPVFPSNVPIQPSTNRAPVNRVPSNTSDRVIEIQRPVTRVETKPITQVVSPQPTPPETPTTPPQVTLAKAPTPWLQNKNKPQEELPEWAKRPSVNRPSSSTSPESPTSQIVENYQMQPQIIQLQQPPLTRQHQPPPPPRQQSLPQERVIPLRIEDRPSVFSVKHEPGHHQLKQQPQPSPHHQQRWGGNSTSPQTPTQSPQFLNQQQPQYQPSSKPQSSGGGTYIVPIMVEGSSNGNGGPTYVQPQQVQPRCQPVQNQSPRVIIQRGPPSPQIQHQGEPGPVQSRSFRVLQKITDTDVPDEVDGGDQLRKLQLTEDDKLLMNKFKEQGRQWVDLCTDQTNGGTQQPADREGSFDHTFVVDGEGNYLHQEEDPRYRGAAIPSRAFRFLQNMTESGDVTTNANAQRGPTAINKRQNRNSRTFEESQANLPASEQQAPEPKKYTGSAIPSRSFRMLQAMTAPESIASEENRPQVTCRTEKIVQPIDHHQKIFLSSASSRDSSSLSLESSDPQSYKMQSQESGELQPLPSGLWQYPDGNCWWVYYPVNNSSRPSSISAQTSSLSSPQLPSSTASNNPHNIFPHANYAFCNGYHHHHHLHNNNNNNQNGNAFVYYQPFYDQSLYPAAAFTAPNGISSFSSDVANSAAQNTSTSSSFSNEEAIGSKEFLLHDDTGDCADISSNSAVSSFSSPSSSTVSSRVARPPSAILHPQNPVCFVPVFIHHQLTKESSGNCNPCLEQMTPGPETNIRCPTIFVVQNSADATRQESRIGWPCQQNLAPTELGPPPWNSLNSADKVDLTVPKSTGFETSQRNSAVLKDPINYQVFPAEKQREEISIKREDNIKAKPKFCTIDSSNKIDESSWIKSDEKKDAGKSNKKWSSDRLKKEEEMEKLGRNEISIAVTDVDESRKLDRLSKTESFLESKISNERLRCSRNSLDGREDDKKSEENKIASVIKKFEAPKWSKSCIEDRENIEKRRNEVAIEETRWNRIDNVSRNLNEAPIKMNILHEEKNSNDKKNLNDIVTQSTDVDYSEDGNGNESDTDIDSTSMESSVEPVCTDPPTNTDETNSSESDSDDSDSYLAYSTGFNPHNKFLKQSNSSLAVDRIDEKLRESQTTIDDDTFDEKSFAMFSFDRVNSTDCESCADEDDHILGEEITKPQSMNNSLNEDFKQEDNSTNRLSVIHEDSEHMKIGSDGWQEVDDSPDDLATINVSLPLRSIYSVKNPVKTEEIQQSEDSNEVYINLKITEDTSVDFTLRKIVSQKTDEDDFWANGESDSKTPETNSLCNDTKIEDNNVTESPKQEEEKTGETSSEDDCIDFWETLKSGNESPDFNFNSKWTKSRLERVSGSQEALIEEKPNDEKIVEENNILVEGETNNFEDNETIFEQDSVESRKELSPIDNSAPMFELTEANIDDVNENEEETENLNINDTKHLLSVQNSRDETDDDDSGVTSDMSRLISEVDTDSECGNTRKINSYKRTQTHSRLFRLLSREDDQTEEMKNSSGRRDGLSLSLKNSSFNYDESHHLSNYSSGLTSPDYSPVYESSWRRVNAEENVVQEFTNLSKSPANVGTKNDDDNSKNRYFDTWKKSQTVDTIREEKTIISSKTSSKTSSNAGSGLPRWRFKTNVLCPRIKSTKNVPRVVRQNRSNAKSVVGCSSTNSKSVVVSNDKC